LKIRHGAIVDNVVKNVYAKSDDDRFRNKKALGLTRRRRRTLVALGDPFLVQKCNTGWPKKFGTFFPERLIFNKYLPIFKIVSLSESGENL